MHRDNRKQRGIGGAEPVSSSDQRQETAENRRLQRVGVSEETRAAGKGREITYHAGLGGIKVGWSDKEYKQILAAERKTARFLCYRCEHRARYLEAGVELNPACTLPGAVTGCSDYLPTKPLQIKKGQAQCLPSCKLVTGSVFYWRPCP